MTTKATTATVRTADSAAATASAARPVEHDAGYSRRRALLSVFFLIMCAFRDAIFITSRACGVCGGVHSTCSALAIEMAIGCRPPKLGIAIRNLALALEFLYDHPLHLHLLAGPD